MVYNVVVSVLLSQFYQDVSSVYRCTPEGYTRVYEDITKLCLANGVSIRDRVELVYQIRYNLCGREMYAIYEEGLDKIKPESARGQDVSKVRSPIQK